LQGFKAHVRILNEDEVAQLRAPPHMRSLPNAQRPTGSLRFGGRPRTLAQALNSTAFGDADSASVLPWRRRRHVGSRDGKATCRSALVARERKTDDSYRSSRRPTDGRRSKLLEMDFSLVWTDKLHWSPSPGAISRLAAAGAHRPLAESDALRATDSVGRAEGLRAVWRLRHAHMPVLQRQGVFDVQRGHGHVPGLRW
jgi:hypothetical protein